MNKKKLFDHFYSRVFGLAKTVSWWSDAVLGKRLIILAYHSVLQHNPELPDWCTVSSPQFEQQLLYITQKFQVVPLLEGLERCRQDDLDGPSVAVTFDDGYFNNLEHAFPLLQRFKVPCTIFLNTGFVGSADILWFNRLRHALERTGETTLEWQGRSRGIRTGHEKCAVLGTLLRQLKTLPHPQLLAEVEEIIRLLGEEADLEVSRSSPYRMLSRRDLRVLLDSGMVDFGAHTDDHMILSRIPRKEQYRQISLSLAKVAELTGRRCEVFAYPNGGREDFDAGLGDFLRSQGVRYALTMISGFNTARTPPYACRRIGVGGDWGMGLFQFGLNTGLSLT